MVSKKIYPVLSSFILLILFSSCSIDNPEPVPQYLADWTEIKPKSEFGAFSDIYFLDDNFGLISGASGRLLKTTDGGSTWNEVETGSEIALDVAFILNENTFAVGGDHSLFVTSDNGDSFKDYTIPIEINDIMMITDKLWYIQGFDNIYRTNDAGNWNLIYSSTDDLLKGMFFTSPETCYAYGGSTLRDWVDGPILSDGFLSKTTDGGDNWVEIRDSAITSAELMKIYFTGSNTGYIANYFGYMHRTNDGGNNWAYADSTGTWIYNLLFTDENTGYYTRAAKKLFKTTDGGENWGIDLNLDSIETYMVEIIKTDNYLYLLNKDGSVYKKSIK